MLQLKNSRRPPGLGYEHLNELFTLKPRCVNEFAQCTAKQICYVTEFSSYQISQDYLAFQSHLSVATTATSCTCKMLFNYQPSCWAFGKSSLIFISNFLYNSNKPTFYWAPSDFSLGQARNQLVTPGEAEFLGRGKFFKLCPTHISRRDSPP